MSKLNTHSNTLKRLRFFNEKGKRLWNSAFMESILNKESGWKFGIETKADGTQIGYSSHSGPNRDAIDAFVLTFRFFIQDNEGTSFRQMHNLYSTIPINASLKSNFDKMRNDLNAFLDSNFLPNVVLNGNPLSNREIMEVFIFGGLAHSTKVETFEKWMNIMPLNAILPNGFNLILVRILNTISAISALNDQVVLELLENLSKE